MGLSFEESMKKILAEREAAAVAEPATMAVADYGIATADVGIMTLDESQLIAAYSGDESWMEDTNYLHYAEYSDDNISIIDDEKNIALNEKQFNITQETNSQYIPFEMPRYYDGFDLRNASIFIHYVNMNKDEDRSAAVNVTYTDTKIRFGWLVGKTATAVEGKLEFEIEAIGTNSRGEEYIWKTKPSGDQLNVLRSISGNGMVEPDETWITGFLTQVTEKVGEAQIAANEAKAAISTVESYAQAAANSAAEAQAVVDTAKVDLESTIETTVNDEVTAALLNYYTKSEVDQIVSNIDISDQLEDIQRQIDSMDGLANFNVEYDGSTMTFYNGQTVMKSIEINSDPSAEWTAAYTAGIDEKIAASKSESQSALDEYKTTVNADLESIHADIDGLPETLATDYYNKTDADSKFATKEQLSTTNTTVSSLSSSVDTNKGNITALGTKVGELETAISGIDQSPRLTYDATYNTEGDYTFKLEEIQNEGDSENEVRTVKAQFVIQGGSGGSSTSSVLKIEYITKTPFVVTANDKAEIKYNFSGTDSSGDSVMEGSATWKVNGTIVATNTAVSGENVFDITNHLNIGTQKVNLSITDDAGSLVTKTWTVQKVDVRFESDFNDKLTYPIGNVTFDYTPYGAISKDIHFILDGKEIDTVTTSASGIPMGYTLPSQNHGAHLLEAYMTATVNNNTIESNHVYKDIIWYDATSSIPVIGCKQQSFTARQYDTTNIEYTVYDPSTETPSITLAVDGNVVANLTMDSNIAIWQYKSSEVGVHTLTITCGETVKTLTAKIEKLDIELEPVTAGLVFDFNPSGKTNNDAERLWSDGDIAMTVSENFDWVNGGYQIDENGDQYFCIKAGTTAEINYKLFEDDAKRNGKEFKLVFRTTNVAKPDTMFLSCIDNTTETDHIGIQMAAHEAVIYGQGGNLQLPYSEEDIIEFEFNISKNTESIPMVMGYEDGVSTRPMVYDDSYNFTQNTPQTISLGSVDCDLHIYRFKVYNTSLTARGILNNFIADARNAEEMIVRYERNQIYDENQNLDPDVLAEKCPWLRVYKISAPYFTNNKSDKVPYTTIQQIYKNGDSVLDNWTCYDCSHSGQGTSSNNYGAAGRNLDFIMNKSQRDGVDPYFILGDGSRATEITMTRTSVPVAYLNAKVNIASSNNMTNAMLANRYNEFNPYKRKFIRDEGVDTSLIKDTMEFHNCVIFIQETNEDVSTHREFADTNWHFYAIGNIGDSKKTDKTRLTDINDKYECCVEIMDVELPLSDWPANTMYNAMGYKVDEKTEEKIYTWAKDENLGILHELIDGEYVLTQDEHVDLNKIYYVDILEHDDFSEDFTYGWRYIYEGDDETENAEVLDYCKHKWIDLYRFITTSTDEEFKEHFEDYFVKDSALYYYLFTTRYCMIDNRAKNSFWHYGKTGEVDGDGNPIRKWDLSWAYDCDSSLGLNNYGAQVYRYGLEDTDVDENGVEVFRESDSTFFCRVRDLFHTELKTLYNTLESKNAWHAESFINKADAWQNEFPEELWRIDIDRKYIRTYNESFINGEGDSQFLVNMSNGKMKYQRRQWERSQEKYMASKYQSSTASSDNAVFRCTVPTGELAVRPNYKLKLIPYAYMYLNVKYGTQSPIQLRAVPNVEYEIPFEGTSADIIDVYSASLIQSFGDLSSCYPATVDTSKASKIKELIIGNETDGYDNPSLTTLTTGANSLLETLNVENVSGLTQTLNLTALNNLRELYAHGSNVGGVTFANGGRIEIAELPAIGALSIKNLAYLSDLDIVSLDKLTTATIENCNTVDVKALLEQATKLNRVRIIGIDWALDDTSLLESIYDMAGIDKSGYNIPQSVLAGKVHVPVIRQQQLHNYRQAWSDLEIVADTIIEQFPVTFLNEDGTVLDIQYVDKGSDAVDPITRTIDPIDIPVKESSVQYDYTFAGWDSTFTDIFAERTITATYTESIRSYTIKYVSKGTILQESTGLYGENIIYEGSLPTYTLEEGAYKYYLFNRWDKSGFIDGDKTVNAIFDSFTYTPTAFDGKELADMSPVEVYALTKLGLDTANVDIQDGDDFTFTIGYDVDYDDIESVEIINERTVFTGSNYIDTGIKLFDEDRDFVLAVDYNLYAGNTLNNVLMQCFQSNGSNGIKLWYNSGVKFTWGTASAESSSVDKREMMVIRHKKGENNLTIYTSNLDGTSYNTIELERNKSTSTDSTLVFGCAKADDGAYENYATGEVNWCKLWYKDLGDKACEKLAGWIHENVTLEVCGFKKYYLTENPSKRCTFSLLATHLLNRNRQYNGANSNAGGWANSALNNYLNTRLYNSLPDQMKLLIKQVTVASSIGGQSTEISTSECYITIPAVIEVTNNSSLNIDPYIYEGTTISYMISNEMRKRAYVNGDYASYWLRSPNAGYANNYVYRVENDGSLYGFANPSNSNGVLIEISI